MRGVRPLPRGGETGRYRRRRGGGRGRRRWSGIANARILIWSGPSVSCKCNARLVTGQSYLDWPRKKYKRGFVLGFWPNHTRGVLGFVHSQVFLSFLEFGLFLVGTSVAGSATAALNLHRFLFIQFSAALTSNVWKDDSFELRHTSNVKFCHWRDFWISSISIKISGYHKFSIDPDTINDGRWLGILCQRWYRFQIVQNTTDASSIETVD